MISDEAVEAAAKAVEDQTSQWLYPVVGGNAHDIAAMALEAAAPHILRVVADEFDARLPDGTGNGRAYNSYQVARMLREKANSIDPNAYRSQL